VASTQPRQREETSETATRAETSTDWETSDGTAGWEATNGGKTTEEGHRGTSWVVENDGRVLLI